MSKINRNSVAYQRLGIAAGMLLVFACDVDVRRPLPEVDSGMSNDTRRDTGAGTGGSGGTGGTGGTGGKQDAGQDRPRDTMSDLPRDTMSDLPRDMMGDLPRDSSSDGTSDATPAKKILFVVGTVPIVGGSGDDALRHRMVTRHFDVTIERDTLTTVADTTNKDLILVSETADSIPMATVFRDLAKPIICLNPILFDDFRMTGPANNTDYGLQTESNIKVVDISTTLDAGFALNSIHDVTGNVRPLAWGKPGASAKKIARIFDSNDRYVIFGYLTGATLVGAGDAAVATAPARRLGSFASAAAAADLSADGRSLFDAAIDWSLVH